MQVTIEQIRNIIPAAIARIPIHFQTSAFFSTYSRSSGVMHLFTTQPFKPRQAATSIANAQRRALAACARR
jgi:hypothetical protein